MSMTILTILQICAVFMAYMVVTCVMPLVIINRLLAGLRLSEKILLSVVSGNFFIINEVFVLQLLHISNHWTLLTGTVAVFLAAVIRVYRIPVKTYAGDVLRTVQKLLKRQLGQKSLALREQKKGLAVIGRFFRKILNSVRKHPLEVLLFLGATAMVLRVYMPNLLNNYGYCTSDIPVHNYWINYLSKGQLFVAGVYPFGFHCAIYYLHAVFGFETFVLLRVFCLIQTLLIHWMMLLFLKACLKSAYLAYLGTVLYVFFNIFQGNTYSRYASSLPQEFGMIFILPAVYFGFAYFRTRKKWCLTGFAMSFSLTLAVHFYDLMIAGLFCVAMAIGFSFRFFRKKYFVPVIVTCAVSVAVAVAPMVIAYATGTPLQGSLGWGLNVISASSEAESETSETEETESSVDDISSAAEGADGTADSSRTGGGTGETGITVTDGAGTGITEAGGETETGITVTAGVATVMKGAGGGSTANGSAGATGTAQKRSITDRLKGLAGNIRSAALSAWELFGETVYDYISLNDNSVFLGFAFGSIALCILLAVVYLLLHEFDQAGKLLTVGIFMIFLNVLLAAGRLGLPRLMDGSRASIYYAYMLPMLWCFSLDGILSLPGRLLHRPVIGRALSLAVVVLSVAYCIENDMVRAPIVQEALETNEAVTCLTNIIRDHDDWTWTICSANDELRMGEDYGYHYETITFLRAIENIGRYAGVKIPTKYTYFFVEKKPLDYATAYANSGQYISEEGASMGLPVGSGLGPYKGENRWIVMSRMYYWCETFMEMYPENMTVYYEDDDFICYQLVQNPDHLFELGIDYGYNNFYQ
jgi:hypothetical protein